MARASKISCNPDDLRRQGSAVRGAQGYANHHGACSNRDALPVCMTRHPRQFAANSGCRLVRVDSAASFQSLSIIMRLRNSAHPTISGARHLTTATLEAVGRPTVGPALLTEGGPSGRIFSQAGAGWASSPARRVVGHQAQPGRHGGHAGRRSCRRVSLSSPRFSSRVRKGLSTVR